MSTSHGYYLAKREIHETIKQSNRRIAGIAIAVFHELCFRARYNGNLVDGLEIGECFFGRDELAHCLGFTVQSVRSALIALEKLTLIQPVTNQKATRVSIRDKSIYGTGAKQTNPKVASNQPQTNLNLNPNQEKGKRKGKVEPPTPADLLAVLIEKNPNKDPEFLRAELDLALAWYADRGKVLGRAGLLGWANSNVFKDHWKRHEQERAKADSPWI